MQVRRMGKSNASCARQNNNDIVIQQKLLFFGIFMEQQVIFGGLNCDILPTDDPKYKPCDERLVPHKYVNFMFVRDINEWYFWMKRTLIPNVRVQPWYNDDPPYGLKGYLNDRANRIIGYAIIRQVREKMGTCRYVEKIDSCILNLLRKLFFPLKNFKD